MAAVILTFCLTLLLAGAAFLFAGSRFRFSKDDEQNDKLNFAAYFLGVLPIAFVLVFFGLGG